MNTFEEANQAHDLLKKHWEENPRKTQTWNRLTVMRPDSEQENCFVAVEILDHEDFKRTARKVDTTAAALGVYALIDRISVEKAEPAILHTQSIG